jgi:hypothetical protein
MESSASSVFISSCIKRILRKFLTYKTNQPSTSTNIYRKTISEICPIPQPKPKSKKINARLGTSIILTKTPIKIQLEEKQIKKEAIDLNKSVKKDLFGVFLKQKYPKN